MKDGTLWMWGYNNNGQLGFGDLTSRSVPTQLGTDTNWAYVRCGWYQTYALKSDGTLWTWGKNNTYGSLGHGDLVNRSSPVQVGTETYWSQVRGGNDVMILLKNDGTLWGCGSSTSISDVGGTNRSSPVQIGASSNWTKVDGKRGTFFAINSSGQLWAWGAGTDGMGGWGSTGSSNLTQIGSETDWHKVRSGPGTHTIGIRNQ